MREFKVGEKFYHSTFGNYASKIEVTEVTNSGEVIVRVNDPYGDYPPVVFRPFLVLKPGDDDKVGEFMPADAGVEGYKYDDRPCRIGATEEEALAGGKLYHAWWKKR